MGTRFALLEAMDWKALFSKGKQRWHAIWSTQSQPPSPVRTRTNAEAHCAHPTCGCTLLGDESRYCSAYCDNVDHLEPEEGACACGHYACVASRAVPSHEETPTVSIGQGPGRGIADR